jgi:hypothetical protein
MIVEYVLFQADRTGMKIFERDGKMNFIDENNVFVGFDYQASCCEYFGYFFSSKTPDQNATKGDLIDFDPDSYNFDTAFYKYSGQNSEEACVTFRLINSESKEVFLTLFNHHNGYYAHGFEMTVSGTNLYSDNL